MRVGVPAEIKDNEFRVAITPAGAHALTRRGHAVTVQAGAGEGAAIPDEEYVAAGAAITDDVAALWADSEMILKVKEPVEGEYPLLRLTPAAPPSRTPAPPWGRSRASAPTWAARRPAISDMGASRGRAPVSVATVS